MSGRGATIEDNPGPRPALAACRYALHAKQVLEWAAPPGADPLVGRHLALAHACGRRHATRDDEPLLGLGQRLYVEVRKAGEDAHVLDAVLPSGHAQHDLARQSLRDVGLQHGAHGAGLVHAVQEHDQLPLRPPRDEPVRERPVRLLRAPNVRAEKVVRGAEPALADGFRELDHRHEQRHELAPARQEVGREAVRVLLGQGALAAGRRPRDEDGLPAVGVAFQKPRQCRERVGDGLGRERGQQRLLSVIRGPSRRA